MAACQDTQLERAIEEVLNSGNIQPLDVFLHIYESTAMKCSQQFLNKLDTFVSRSLDEKDPKSASIGLTVLYKCGKNLKVPGDHQGLSGMIAQGLVQKMVQWFEKCRHLWIQCGLQWDQNLFNLSEDFFDALMEVHEACKEGTYQITESFLYPLAELAVDPRIYILIQKEAVRKFNLILDKIPADLKKKKKILTSQEASDIMVKLAGQILDIGDYDFQTALMEALCRMASPSQRKELTDRWFSMDYVAKAFTKIRDSEFETDCRKFLNFVNGMQGDSRRVYSYPCLEVYLDKYELLMPSDEKLEEFWIDFNLGSRSISFYFSLADEKAQETQWETICITENEVQSYTVTEEGKRHVLKLELSEVVVVGVVEGSSLTVHFSSVLDILQAAHSVYGVSKDKGFVGKKSKSVVKTTVKILMEENSSQVVPESQMSLGESEKSAVHFPLPGPSAPVQMLTPARMSISASSVCINNSGGRNARGASSFSAPTPSTKGKGKPSLEMVRSGVRQGRVHLGEPRTTASTCSHGNNSTPGGIVEQSAASTVANKNKLSKNKKNIPQAKAVDTIRAGQEEEQCLEHNFVPDTQPETGNHTSSSRVKLSVSETLMMLTPKSNTLRRPELESRSSARRSSVPVHGPMSQQQLHTELTQRLQQVLSERNQDARQGKLSATREVSKAPSSKGQCSSTISAPKERQAERKGPAEKRNKCQMPPDADAASIKAPAKASTATTLLKTNKTLSDKEKRDEQVTGSMVKLISSRYGSSAKDSVSRSPLFAIRSIFNQSWLSTAKREVSGSVRVMKSYSKTATSFAKQREDIFAFTPEPSNLMKKKDKTFGQTSALSSSGINDPSGVLSSTDKGQPVAKEKRHVKKHLFSDTDTDNAVTEVSWLTESSRKPKPKVTKYSRQAPAKPTAVSPHAPHETVDSAPHCQKPVKGPTKANKRKPDMKLKAEQHPKKTERPAAAPTRPQAAGRRPQRVAAASAKSYKEPDTDDSLSDFEYPAANDLENAEEVHEAAQVTKKKTASKQTAKTNTKAQSCRSESLSEEPPVFKKYFVGQQGNNEKTRSEVSEVRKRKTTSAERSTDSYRRLGSTKLSDLRNSAGTKRRPENVPLETSKLDKRRVTPVRDQMNALKNSWAARQTSFCSSPPRIERMRSADRSAPSCSPLLTPLGSPLPASPDPPREDTPSPILLLPRPRSAASSKGNFSSLYIAEKKSGSSKTRDAPSLPSLTPVGQTPTPGAPTRPCAAERRTSPPRSPMSPPLLTSTLLELDKPSVPSPPRSPFPADTANYDHRYSFSKVSSVSLSSSKSSVLSCRLKDSSPAAVLTVKAEKSPPPNRELKSTHPLFSGPSRKRRTSSSSNSEEDEKKERKKSKMREQRSPRMKPRKLFKSFTEVTGVSTESQVSQVSHVMSSSHTLSSSQWEADVGDGDMDVDEDVELPKTAANTSELCQEFGSELKKKFQSRCKMMEVYNKQSLKTVQQHVSSLNVQVNKNRTQRLEQVEQVLLEEIRKLEQGDSALKSMEKDLSMYWKKQSVAFRSYQEQEIRRNETLKKALQGNMCHSLEYEERIFTSQMCLIRKDMKSVQDRLLSQMQEGEIQSVKRSLHALFFP